MVFSAGWPWTCYIAYAGFEPVILLSQPPKVLGFQACIPIPGSNISLKAPFPSSFLWNVRACVGTQACVCLCVRTQRLTSGIFSIALGFTDWGRLSLQPQREVSDLATLASDLAGRLLHAYLLTVHTCYAFTWLLGNPILMFIGKSFVHNVISKALWKKLFN